jgi:SAM-dependent methyltransferase
MPGTYRQSRCGLALLATWALAAVAATPVTGQPNPHRQGLVASLGASDLVTLVTRCGEAEPLEESLELVRKHACSRRRSEVGEILAFEENRWFVYALADMSHRHAAEDGSRQQQATWRFRRVFLLKPSTLVVEDLIHPSGLELPIRWMLRSAAEPKIEAGRFRVTEANTEILGKTVLPTDATMKITTRPASDDRPTGFRVEVTPKQASKGARLLHVFHLGRNAGKDAPTRPKVAVNDKSVKLTVAVQEKVFRLTLPAEGSVAGNIEITAADGTTLVPGRLLPSGVMPHGPKGAGLMERWDAPYRGERLPGWDVGRPCSHLVKAVEDTTFKPGRAIVLGCGSGTNAIYLASKGFEVTGVDVSPTALAIAAEKAHKADVEVTWMVADVSALPKLQPYDLIFDRGCYHHICQYDSPGYVETLRRLSHAGTRAMILAGSPADGNRGGPPRIKEETIRKDFSTLFDFEWLRNIQFDSRNPDARGPSAWSIHLQRKDE